MISLYCDKWSHIVQVPVGPTLKELSSSLEKTNALFILIPRVSAINFKQDNSVSLSFCFSTKRKPCNNPNQF